MFTGIVKERAKVKSMTRTSSGMRLSVYSSVLLKDMQIDDSVSINGACQTVVKKGDSFFEVDTVFTTLDKTTLGDFRPGEEVNLELALRPIDRMGGHMVQGHVNAVGEIARINKNGDNYQVSIKLPKEQFKYIVKEGSITLDGISLTVNDVDLDNGTFEVSIIPHTWNVTTWYFKKIGSKINVEVDILAKYLENLLFHKGSSTKSEALSIEWIRSKGF
jgi:riboflavin synthase